MLNDHAVLIGFRKQAPILLQSIHSVQLDFNVEVYSALSRRRGRYYLMECEVLYGGLLIDVLLILSKAQLNELFGIHRPEVSLVDYATIYVHDYPHAALQQFNAVGRRARLVTIENIGRDDEMDVFILLKKTARDPSPSAPRSGRD